MLNTANTMPVTFKNIVGSLVDKWVAAVSDVKQHNLHELRALVSPNVSACNMTKYMQQPTLNGLKKGKKKAPALVSELLPWNILHRVLFKGSDASSVCKYIDSSLAGI